jgi:hypothetical protein
LPVGGLEHFHPPSSRWLPQIIRRQYPARQQRIDLAHDESIAIGPAFVEVGQVAEGWTRQQVGGPEQKVQEFFGLGLRGGRIVERLGKGNTTFCCTCNKRLSQA